MGSPETCAALNPLSESQVKALDKLNRSSLEPSDAIMGRCISSAISLTWTEEQIKDKGIKMVNVIRKVIARHQVAL